jgi:hypothetical protein
MIRRVHFAVGLLLGLVISTAAMAESPKAVVELFTSQGCSSCPPADAFLSDLIDRGDVVALSLHVDYWDYLGWKDTLGHIDNTERQTAYAAARGDRQIYTPQIIINGSESFVGGDRAAVEQAVKQGSLPVPVSLAYRDEKLEIRVGPSPRPGAWHTTVRLAQFISSARIPITRGENTGATIVYRNIVRDIRPIGMWDGNQVAITLPANEIMTGGADGCAVLVQEEGSRGPGAIVGAAEINIPAGQ